MSAFILSRPRFLSEIATVIGKHADAALGFQHRAGVEAWHHKYYNETLGTYSPCAAEPLGSQTSNAMALAIDAPPDQATRAKVISRLVRTLQLMMGVLRLASLDLRGSFPCYNKVDTATSGSIFF